MKIKNPLRVKQLPPVLATEDLSFHFIGDDADKRWLRVPTELVSIWLKRNEDYVLTAGSRMTLDHVYLGPRDVIVFCNDMADRLPSKELILSFTEAHPASEPHMSKIYHYPVLTRARVEAVMTLKMCGSIELVTKDNDDNLVVATVEVKKFNRTSKPRAYYTLPDGELLRFSTVVQLIEAVKSPLQRTAA